MATVRNLACIAFRPEALDVHGLTQAINILHIRLAIVAYTASNPGSNATNVV